MEHFRFLAHFGFFLKGGRGVEGDIDRCRSSINTVGLVDMRYLDIYFTCGGGCVAGRLCMMKLKLTPSSSTEAGIGLSLAIYQFY